MRYHYEKPIIHTSMYGRVYKCDHQVYNSCTLYEIDNRGLAVIQQRFDYKTKKSWWSEIDSFLTDPIYLHPKFKSYFNMKSGEVVDGVYPTVTIRQIMWGLKMKPIKRFAWETYFDRAFI